MRWLALLLLAGCEVQPILVCLSVANYDRSTQTRALHEMEGLPQGSVLGRMIEDYGDLRARMRRACS